MATQRILSLQALFSMKRLKLRQIYSQAFTSISTMLAQRENSKPLQ